MKYQHINNNTFICETWINRHILLLSLFTGVFYHTLYRATILCLMIWAKEPVWVPRFLLICWHNCSALQQPEKARGQFAQTRNRLQKARMPASHPAGRVLWCTDQEVLHACFIARLQQQQRQGHLKRNFKWKHERQKEEASREAARVEVMDVRKPTALHSLSLPGIVTPVSC